LLILGAPPPVKVKGRGAMMIEEAIGAELDGVSGAGADSAELRRLDDDIARIVAWTTWADVNRVVCNAVDSYGVDELG
jgi:hypothetical protein